MNPHAAGASRYRAALAIGLVTSFAGTLLALAPTPAEAAATANLRVTTATVDKTTVVEGAKVTVTHVVKNVGSGEAGASATRVYLTKNVAASLEERRTSTTNPRSALTDLRAGRQRDRGDDRRRRQPLDRRHQVHGARRHPGR